MSSSFSTFGKATGPACYPQFLAERQRGVLFQRWSFASSNMQIALKVATSQQGRPSEPTNREESSKAMIGMHKEEIGDSCPEMPVGSRALFLCIGYRKLVY